MKLPFFEVLASSRSVLLAGMGGGFDIFSGLPLYFWLKEQQKTVHLANLSFSNFYGLEEKQLAPSLWKIDADCEPWGSYFPEIHLCDWLKEALDDSTPIYCIERTAAAPVRRAYEALLENLGGVDTILLVDGGTDSLMRGDEVGLGTPQEDLASLAAVDSLENVPTKLLASIGFGIDTFHGVCHAHWLENVAALTKMGAFLGSWSMTPDMPEAVLYKSAVDYVHKCMEDHPSIVNSSILSAVWGEFGNHHTTDRTEGSELFINPLMTIYWAFEVGAVAKRHLFLDDVKNTETFLELSTAISRGWGRQARKDWQDIPH
ncbi:MAG: DUF1152 domain-containing protein [Armatimonas sp.]